MDYDWGKAVRGTPLGVLILSALLFLVGAGLVLGGFYLAISAAPLHWAAWVMALVVGPLAIYLALHLVRLTRWAWLAVVVLLALLLVSSLARAVVTPGVPIAPAGEIAVEVAFLIYLTRDGVQRAFGRR